MNAGVRSGAVGMVSRAAIQLLVFGVTIVATRLLSIAEFGIYSIAASLVVLSRNFFYVGPYEYLLKTPDDPGLKGSCLVANFAIAAMMAGVLAIVALFAPALFGTAQVSNVLFAFIPSLFIAAATAWFEAILLRGLRVQHYYAITVSAELVAAITAVALLLLSYGILSLVVQVYVRLLTMFAIYTALLPERPWTRMTRGSTRTVLMWSWRRYTTVLLNFTTSYGADLILGVLLSPTATGIYRASNRIVLAVSDLFAQPLQKIIFTATSARSSRREPPGADWLNMFTGASAIGWAALAGLAVGAPDLIPLALGEKWRVAAPVVTVLCAARALTLLDVATSAILVCYDRQHFMLRIQATIAAATLLASFWLAAYGPRGVAFGTCAICACYSIAFCREAVRISASSAGDVRRALVVALVPATMVVLAVLVAGWIAPLPGAPGWIAALRTLAAAAVGLLAGILIVRHDIVGALGKMGLSQVEPIPS